MFEENRTDRPATIDAHGGLSRAHVGPRVTSEQLLQGARRVVIVHRGEEYILQVTRAGRLIMTK